MVILFSYHSAAGPRTKEKNTAFFPKQRFLPYINAIDIAYDSEDVIFTGYIYSLDTPQFNRVNKSQYGRGTDFEKDIVEYIGNNCYIPTSGNCFIKCMIYFTNEEYTEEFLTFIRTEKHRSGVMTSA